MSTFIKGVLRTSASSIEIPVIIILVILILAALILLGSLICELFTERRHLKVRLPALVDEIKASSFDDLEHVIEEGGLLRRQKAALLEVISHPALDSDSLEALAVRLLEEESAHYAFITKLSDLIMRLGPMFGLLGTLIPLGPGIIALGEGDTYTLSQSLLTAFDTTIAGLIAAAIATVVSLVRKSWYKNYMSILETAMECILKSGELGVRS